MKPVFETVVLVKPNVWKIKPLPKSTPASTARLIKTLLKPCRQRGLYKNMKSAASMNRDAKKE
jgi:hypothetical protein